MLHQIVNDLEALRMIGSALVKLDNPGSYEHADFHERSDELVGVLPLSLRHLTRLVDDLAQTEYDLFVAGACEQELSKISRYQKLASKTLDRLVRVVMNVRGKKWYIDTTWEIGIPR